MGIRSGNPEATPVAKNSIFSRKACETGMSGSIAAQILG